MNELAEFEREELENKIIKVLRENPKGMWIEAIARKLQISRWRIRYAIKGKEIDGTLYGGWLRNKIDSHRLNHPLTHERMNFIILKLKPETETAEKGR